MSVVNAIILLYLHSATVIWAFLYLPRLPQFITLGKRSPPLNVSQVLPGEPLFLTPLVDSGQHDEAKKQSLIQPAIGHIESYAGFLTVNRTTKSHLYFWFIPRTVDGVAKTPEPFLLWLQGGPGCSSLFGLFGENGPFQIVKNAFSRRKYAWTNDFHMLYIDQPVGTGFSFTEDENNGYIDTEKEVGEHLYEALLQFYKIFPEMLRHDFYISGESYAGKYIPSLAYKIYTTNRHQSDNGLQIPLKGMMIGNAVSDPINLVYHAEYLHGLGFIDLVDRQRMEALERKTMYLIQSEKWEEALEEYLNMGHNTHILNYTSIYDYTTQTEDGTEIDDAFVEFINVPEVRKIMHVGHRRYELCSTEVHHRFRKDFLKTVRPWIEKLLEHYPMLFYHGQFDLACPHPNSQKFLSSLRWSGAVEYGLARRQLWALDNKTIGGFYKFGSNLVDVWVRNVGHLIHSRLPKNGLMLINMFINGQLQRNSTLQ